MASVNLCPIPLPQSLIFGSQVRRSLKHTFFPIKASLKLFSLSQKRMRLSPLCRPTINPLYSSVSLSIPPSEELLESLPENLQSIITLFHNAPNSRVKYEELLRYGAKLMPLDPRYRTSENKVQGCLSQVWVHAYLDPDRNVQYEADSDSAMTKGLAALLIKGLSGQPPLVIARIPPDFIQLLGFQQSLSLSRNNGFLNMLKLMQNKALCLHATCQVSDGMKFEPLKAENLPVVGDLVLLDGKKPMPVDSPENANQGHEDLIQTSLHGINELDGVNDDKLLSEAGLGSRMKRIKEVLGSELHPLQLEVEDISYQHSGHAAMRGKNSRETHFNVKVVSDVFTGKSLVKRHRIIYDLMQQELHTGLHALSIVAKAPSEIQMS